MRAVAATPMRDVERRLDALRSTLPEGRGDEERMGALVREVATELRGMGVGTRQIRAISDDALSAAIGLVADVNFYAPGSHTEGHRALFAELDRRGAVAAVDVDDLHRTLVADRLWKDAGALSERFPDVELQPLPSEFQLNGDSSSGGALAWQVEPNGTTVVRNPVEWPEGVALLVISHPGCGFSRRMLQALDFDKGLDAALPGFRVFLAPTFGTFGFREIHAWNKKHPTLFHVLVDRPAQWGAWVSNWETPQLIFLVDGVVKERVVGWPAEGKRSEILEATKRLDSPAVSL